MATTCFNYAFQNKMVSQQLRNISSLGSIVREIEKLNLGEREVSKA